MNLDKFKGCILGVAIGDALGMPVERMTAEKIREIVGELRDFLPASVNPKPFPEFEHMQAGSWTDDTQLTLAVMEALIESGGRFDMDVIARRHIEAYASTLGWGRSTRNACKRLSQGVHWSESGEPGGSGNGVMMKIAPLGLLRSMNTKTIDMPAESIAFAKMTHLATPAIVAGGVHEFAISMLPNFGPSIIFFGRFLESWAKNLEEKLPPHQDKISEQISLVLSMYHSGELVLETPETLGIRFGVGTKAAFSAFNSFALSYALFLRNPHSFDAVFDAVNAGGDTDTNASIVGSLLGAFNGMSVIPENLLTGLDRREFIEERIEKFWEVCVSADL